MKKILFSSFVSLMLVLSACGDREEVVFSGEGSYFAFARTSAKIAENGAPVQLRVDWAKVGAREASVQLEVVTTGLEKPAVEGVDFTISLKTLNFGADDFSQVLTITPIDNEDYTGDKAFYIRLKSVNTDDSLGSEGDGNNQILVTLVDDEHPLAALLGDIVMVYEPGDEDLVSFRADETYEDILWLEGVLTEPLKVQVATSEEDEDSFVLTITLPQEGGVTAGYPSKYYGLFVNGDRYSYTSGEFVLTGTCKKDNIDITFDHGMYLVALNASGAVLGGLAAIYPGDFRLYKE